MSSTINYPSRDLPGPVQVELDLPDGWKSGPAPMVAFAAVASEAVGGVYSNVVVAVRRVDEGLTLDEVGEMIAADLDDVEGAERVSDKRFDLAGAPAVQRQITIASVDADQSFRLIQVATLVKLGDGVADLVSLTATLSGTAPEAHVASCVQIARSLRVGPTPAT